MPKDAQLSTELKYQLYEKSVQNPGFEVEFLRKTYKQLTGKKARSLREDFCGTGAISCSWVADDPKNTAIGIDLDPEPILQGKKTHWNKLDSEAKQRMTYLEKNVLEAKQHKADMVVAFNFSYMIFTERQLMLKYFKSVRKSLDKNGLFLLDILGGPESQTLCEEETEHDDFSYFWDCDEFDPINNLCRFYIHFKYKGTKYERAFTYEWRLWSIPELRDLLLEAGFSNVTVFWEGDDGDGGGDGEFEAAATAENSESWVAYIAAQK